MRVRKKQCDKCPWRKDVDPNDIPNGYDVEKHRGLEKTIDSGLGSLTKKVRYVMACHESLPGKEQACAGWVYNQIGVGNNLGLRMAAATGDLDLKGLEVVGEQHERLEDTLPQ